MRTLRIGALVLLGALTVSHARTVSDPASPPRNPLLSTSSPSAEERSFVGEVRTVAPAGPYTYLEVATQEGAPRWVAVVAALSPVVTSGQRVAVSTFGAQSAFRSRRLGRTFDRLLFGRVSLR